MDAIILLAHGSRSNSAINEAACIAKSLQFKFKDEIVFAHAFLEIASPDIFERITELLSNNANINHIKIFPYFLSDGKHVKQDIPNILEALKRQYKKIQFSVTPHLGEFTDLPTIIYKYFKSSYLKL